MGEERKWKISDLVALLLNSIKAIFRGEFLLKLKVSKYFLHIAYAFFLFSLVILFSLGVDTTLSKVETNKAILKDLETEYAQKTFELARLNRRSTLDEMLKEKGSKVTEPQKQATILKR